MAELTYKEKIDRLEEITKKLEQGEMEIEDSMSCFEEGIALLKECEKELETVEQKVMILTESDEEKPFKEEGEFDE